MKGAAALLSFAAGSCVALAAAWPADHAEPRPPIRVADAAAQTVSYDRDVRPLLSDRCFVCHGSDGGKREADLRLDLASNATAERIDKTTGAVRHPIVPGNLEASELWRRLTTDDPDDAMPPRKSTKRPLSDDEKALIRRWIEEGAHYESHWSFAPPSRPAVPQVRDTSWPRGTIDAFILAKLERTNVTPNPETDRATLLRRVFLDLTGLPPTPEELDAFLADVRPDAYERWVDRLLGDEPYRTRYAERMASPWLDQARYGDTCGIHHDESRSIWPWRDWVLKAYRENMRFDQFVTEQLAGDLLPNATIDQRVATGFLRNNVTSDEGGAIDEEYRFEYEVDRVATAGAVFMGLTMQCARCHDHKFDPVTMEDFYGLVAFFNSNDEPGLYPFTKEPDVAFPPALIIPTPDKEAEIQRLDADLARAKTERDGLKDSPEQRAAFETFVRSLGSDGGVRWVDAMIASATSAGGATMTPQSDGSVLASGANPGTDDHVFTLRTDAKDLRAIFLDALVDPSMPGREGVLGNAPRVGRSDNGNVVLTGIEAEAVSIKDPAQRQPIHLTWAWADVEQFDGDYRVVNAIDRNQPPSSVGWAVNGQFVGGPRMAMFLANEPFGFDGGTEVKITLQYRSQYAAHAFGRVRLSLAQVGDAGLTRLPAMTGSWYRCGPFPAKEGVTAFDVVNDPEAATSIDLTKEFALANRWRLDVNLKEATAFALAPTVGAEYVARTVYAPSPRRIELSLGSDDGLRVFANGKEVHTHRVERSLSADTDQVAFDVPAGRTTLVFKIVNTGGPAAFFHRAKPSAGALDTGLIVALLPASARTPEREARARDRWLLTTSPAYLALGERIGKNEADLALVKASLPRTMIWKEIEVPRDTFVRTRGQYDLTDKNRRVDRAVPAFLGALPDGAPRNRLGLAQWLTSPTNPLLARVTANRIWELFFGRGLVRTTEDFGMQGEWPTHPELLDWLAVDFRENRWDVQRLIKTIVTSATYRQSARLRPDVVAHDPDGRLIASFPRQRLPAEALRDQALYVGGLLTERLGGPSVKPYQPPGLWEEIAMPDSNTRVYERSMGDNLWRRSVYTYWKRAAPPPSMLTFDAPTREFCTVRRIATNTPLQALVLWNDEQFVEAARALASRTLHVPGDDRARVAFLMRSASAHEPTAEQADVLLDALRAYRSRFAAAPEDAVKLLAIGASKPPDGMEPSELAAWTMIANAVLSADATLIKD
ncbi:MAG: PSD1 and planctomycete cytochrome C domain-containing protein [Phycisphaerae bacterium]|nr:PSD1 and planctomycete cytochrome C domain-containing protein [Phycisphaerae bacterium]